MPTCYLGLGSNLKSPRRQLQNALNSLRKLAKLNIEKISSIYHTPPMGPKAQPNYQNLVIEITTNLSPQRLLQELKTIEQQQNRCTKIRWGARSIDIDILLYGNLKLQSENLTIPHLGLMQRDFVLIPLTELNPNLYLPCGTKIPSSTIC